MPTLSLDRYLPARQTLDASRFGCSEKDYLDAVHVDINCMRMVFAVAFGSSHASDTAVLLFGKGVIR